MESAIKFLSLAIISIMLMGSCGQADYSPKPRGYYRIDLPEKIYQIANTGCPFSFEIPAYSELKDDTNKGAKPCWKNLEFPEFNATLHISYFDIDQHTTFDQLTEDARTFVFKHTSKASAIDQKAIRIPEKSVYGLQYDIKGNTASNTQFYVSDSSRHYLRAALYFNEKPNVDSIQPVLNFLKQDIETLINTLTWK